MKAFLLLFLFCTLGFAGHSQTRVLHFNTYAQRCAFIDSLNGYINSTPLKQGLDTLNSLEGPAMKDGDIEFAMEIKLRRYSAICAYHTTINDTIEYKLKEIAAEAAERKFIFVEADAMQAIGDYFVSKHQQSAAIAQYIAAYEFYKNLDGKEYTSKEVHICALGSEFYKLEDYDNALKYFKEATAIMLATNTNHFLYCSLLNTMGLCYRNMKIFDSAISCFQLCLKQAELEQFKPYQGIAAGNIGITFFLQKKYTEAVPLLQQDIATSIETFQIQNAARSMYTLATIYNEQQKYADAERILKQALTMCEGRHFWPVYSLAGPIYKQLYVVYAAQKDYHKAYLYADSAMIANDSLAAQTNILTLAKAHDQLEYTRRKLESEKLQNQINNAKIEISKNRIIMLFAISGIGILLVVVLFIIRLNNKVNNQKKELEKLNAVKDRIFSIIGHDLRAPVNSVVSFTQLLEHGDIPPEKLQKYAGVLKDTLGHTVTLMENLLNWARTQMQGYNPVFEQFDLAETAMQCMALLTPDADKKKIAIINNITEGAIISSDFNMVSLLVRNLLSNAIKYTPPGGIIILSAIVAANKVQIKVKDTGVGIAPALVHNFNKSASVQPLESTPGTNKEKGTGLGLMLCKDFASLMRGKITLESEPGKGSCFVVELPT